MKKLIFIFILAFGFISCNSDELAPIDNDETQIVNSDLIGKWNWILSCGGLTGDCWGPSDGYFESIEFKKDYSFIEKINGEIYTETNYSITDSIINGSDKLFIIEFQTGFTTYFRFIDANLSIQGGDFWKEYEKN